MSGSNDCDRVERPLYHRLVDSEKRLDIAVWYSAGGWPTVAILHPTGEIRQHRLFASRYVGAVYRLQADLPVAVIAGTRESHAARALHAEALRLPLVGHAVHLLDPIADLETLKRFGIPQKRTVQAFACWNDRSIGPVESPTQLSAAVDEAVEQAA